MLIYYVPGTGLRFICMSLFNPNDSHSQVLMWFLFTNEEMEAQRGEGTYPGSQSKRVVESRLQDKVIWMPDCMCPHTAGLPSKVKSCLQIWDICSCLVHLPMSQPTGKYFWNNCTGPSGDFVVSSRWQPPSGAENSCGNLNLTGLDLILWEGEVCWGPQSPFSLPKGR